MENEQIAQLKSQAGTRPYESRLSLQVVGKEYKAFCPWHEADHRGNPSLSVFEDKQNSGAYSFKCMAGCAGKEGDVLKFVQLLDGVGFGETLKRVSDEVGFKIPDEKSFAFDSDRARTNLRKSPEALAYLASRGIDAAQAEASQLGYFNYPGIGPTIAIPYGEGVYKFRALEPKDKNSKFRHLKDKPSRDLLFGIDRLDSLEMCVYVCESELDCLTLIAHGYGAVSVSSATTCLDKDGKLLIKSEHLDALRGMDKIVLALDQDDAGKKCAAAFHDEFPEWQLVDLTWDATHDTATGKDVFLKDVGEVYTNSPADFWSNISVLYTEAINRPPKWRQKFHTIEEISDEPIVEYIKGFLPEGITMIGSLSGVGKSLLAFSMAKAITTGKKFLGRYETTKENVIYMCPEMGEKLLRKRAMLFGLHGEAFLIASMSDGLLQLDDPMLLKAVAVKKPVVFLDTAIRFSNTQDENAASQNQNGLFKALTTLIKAGAKAVVCLHHSPKAAMKQPFTLETTLRGTGDIGAMADAVWGLRWFGEHQDDLDESAKLTRFRVKNLKPRDLDPIDEFVVQGKPFINEQGDFVVTDLNPTDFSSAREVEAANQDSDLNDAVTEHPEWSVREIADDLDIGKSTVARRLKVLGWQKVGGNAENNQGGKWERISDDDPAVPLVHVEVKAEPQY